MPWDCPKCRVPLLDGPTADQPVEWACVSCGEVLREPAASFEARRSAALSDSFARMFWKRAVRGEGSPRPTEGTRAEAANVSRLEERPQWEEDPVHLWTDWPGEAFDGCEAGWGEFEKWQRTGSHAALDKAEEYLRRAAEQGESLAYETLGEIALAKNQGVEAYPPRANNP